jgi:opacity protein-like surface antigen
MRKSIVSAAAVALALGVPASAWAQTSGGSGGSGACPPGSWFCAQDQSEQASPAGKPLQPLPDPSDDGAPVPPKPPKYDPGDAPPVVVYQPPPPVVVVQHADVPPPPEEYRPAHRPPPARPEWGVNLHLEGLTIGRGTGSNDASMGGGGLGLRLRPTRYFAVETDVDFVGGTDYQGDHRNETGITVNGLFFLNPRSRAQIYLLAGFGVSGASVNVPSPGSSIFGDTGTQHYDYFGGQIGAGLELRLSHNFALNADVRGFLRGRTDQYAASHPEFMNADGRTTNTSGGGLLTIGMTIYF